ncbi:Tetratricopeptide repeat protein 37 [Blattella germanica]|nr:Tetratricopeptide repeat protein 37 [Blattella germanica]
MDAKEIKQYLKSARESIKNKDFKTALQLCKNVLKYDRNNYNGLVLFGVALQDTDQKDQAPKAFRKAVEVSPKQSLAWQGLASYYEKENSETEQKELFPIYHQLLSLESDLGKFTDVCNKLGQLTIKLSKFEECAIILKDLAEKGTPDQKKIIWKTALETALETVVKDPTPEDKNIQDYYKKYLRLLYKNNKKTLLLDEARNMHLLYPKSDSALEWICKVYSEHVALNLTCSKVFEDNIEGYYKKLDELNWESSLSLLAKGAYLLRKANYDPNEDLESLVLALLVKSLSLQTEEDKLKECVNKCVKCMTRAHIMLGNKHETEKCLQAIQNSHKSTAVTALLTSLYLKKQNKLSEALKATKLDPNSYICYVYLGHYYRSENRDLDKARRCYQKAFLLNPNCKEAGAGLSDTYRLQKNDDANVQLLTYVTQTVGCIQAKWAWLRLGLHHIDKGNHQQAIDSMLSVIRADPTDSYSWECLADAYYGRGAYTASMKSYQKVLELDPEAVYPAFQMGNIKQNLLYNHPTYVPALKGLGETYLCQARNYLSRQLVGCCRDSCQRAVDVLIKAAQERKDLSCLWKLVGDACTLVVQLPVKYSQLCVMTWITNSDDEEKNELTVLEKEQVFQLGIRCYCRALSININNINNSLLWHDVAHLYNLQANFRTEPEVKQQLREHALAAIKKSIHLNSKDWQHWNLLGVIAASPELSKLALAQHAFIKAIQLENNAMTWTNLGTLYLSLSEIKMAHKAFEIAQKTEPSYVQCWIGQLGIHLESCIGYAHWVCKTLKSNIDRTDPHYVYSHIKNNPCAYNMFGLLLERQQLYQGAAQAFELALRVLDNSKDDTLSDMVRSNYGRVLVQLQQYEDAINQYKEVKKADTVTQCGLALAYFKANKYQESYSAYETALEWLAPTDGMKSHILVAMAAMAYMFQGVEDSKTLLFQW